jgi:hypothetical protein
MKTVSLKMAKKLKECECGCGEMFEPIDSKGRKRRFLPGHNSRVNHPMQGERAKNNKGGVITKYGYKLIYVPKDERDRHTYRKDGYAFEHRYVMERYLGRKLKQYEIVHHKNGNKLDNRIENLKLMTISSHAKYESNQRPVNWNAIEAMKQANIKPEKDICLVDGCQGEVRARGLCNAHYHKYRRGLLQFVNGIPFVVKKKKQQPCLQKVCEECGKTFMARSNQAKYCEVCRQPYMKARRYRERRKKRENSISNHCKTSYGSRTAMAPHPL